MVVARDVTARQRAEQERTELLAAERIARAAAETSQRRATFLAEASALLDTSLSLEQTFANVARMSVPYLAEFCSVSVVDAGGPPRRMAVAVEDARAPRRARGARAPLAEHADGRASARGPRGLGSHRGHARGARPRAPGDRRGPGAPALAAAHAHAHRRRDIAARPRAHARRDHARALEGRRLQPDRHRAAGGARPACRDGDRQRPPLRGALLHRAHAPAQPAAAAAARHPRRRDRRALPGRGRGHRGGRRLLRRLRDHRCPLRRRGRRRLRQGREGGGDHLARPPHAARGGDARAACRARRC